MANDEAASDGTTPTTDRAVKADRDLDLVGLRALAHPLRVQIFDALSTYGSFTASGLAERLGESSGATSYHLRQLEKHGFVREVEGMGTSRERWWERTPGAINIGSEEATATPAGRSAATMIFRQMRYTEEQMISDFVEKAADEMPQEWLDGSAISTMNTRLTPEQLKEFTREMMALTDKYVLPNKKQFAPNTRPIHIGFQAFPVADGELIPEETELKKP
jgi:DNA-binding transcriptional ArsR family regulator